MFHEQDMAVKKVTTDKPAKKTAAKKVKAAPEKTAKAVPTEKAVVKEKSKATEKVVPVKVEKVEKTEKSEKMENKISEKYFYAVGRRKTSVAQVRLFENDKATEADMIINGKMLKDYFPTINHQNTFLAPLKAVGLMGKVRMTILVRGGGVNGQVEASRLGISRSLVKMDETFKKTLKELGFMTRDARKVERKKPGLKGARRAPQWAKR
jgi:small subunit ribosomal protein S9